MPAASADVFTDACKKRGVKKPNKHILEHLKAEASIEDLETLDLDKTYVGNRGLMALLDMIEQAPSFRSIDLAHQKIYNTDLSPGSIKGNEVVDRVVEICQSHPAVTSLDFTGNPLSNFAGRKLLHLVNENSNIVGINLNDTRIDMDLVGHISAKCDKNLKVYWEKQNEAMDNGGEATNDDDGFGAATWEPPVQKAPNLGGFGGGMRKKTVMGGHRDAEKVKEFTPKEIPKPDETTEMLIKILKPHLLFSAFDTDALRVLVGTMCQRVLKKGERPINQGDEGDTLYVIEKGQCDVIKGKVWVCTKDEESIFGELELMYAEPCVATIEVKTEECVCWVLDRDTYSNLAVQYSLKKRHDYEEYLSRVGFLTSLSPSERLQLADALKPNEWDAGDYIIRYGEEGQFMFLVVSGVIEVIGRSPEDGEPTVVCEFTEGDHFGELEFLNNHACVADVRAKTACRTAKVERKHFELCFGPVLHILKRNVANPNYEYYKKQLEIVQNQQKK
eukprot:TRINITY_DN9762_c0_g1_i1.p1 TRINITY_DN9762_c0_g1~~TRINITY_DN9762_c0_g1_i1.p1  ORF type:complete len:503 (+),score=223.32 TRINITY_DN9762_c0_g1_i1:170-1678(+)